MVMKRLSVIGWSAMMSHKDREGWSQAITAWLILRLQTRPEDLAENVKGKEQAQGIQVKGGPL